MNLKPPALSISEFYIALGLKVLMGIVYGYIFLHFYHGDDTWKIHRMALEETNILLHDPALFFIDQYTPFYAFRASDSFTTFTILYASDLEYAFIVKTIAIFNLISQGNYYFNVFLFNLILFWGHYWLFVLFKELFPDSRKILFTVIFLFLPAVFWLSGIRSDGLLFFFLSLFMLNMYRRKNILLIILAFVCVTAIRPQFGILLALASAPVLITLKNPRRTLTVFFATYILAGIIFFTAGLESAIINIRDKFILLKGTRFEMPLLEPNVISFIRSLPNAINHVFFRPYLWEVKSPLQFLYALEIIFFWSMVVMMFLKLKPGWKERLSHPVILMMIFLALSVCLLTGYIVPFPGAIVRYRIIPELLLLCIIAANIQIKIKQKHNITDLSKKLTKTRP